MKNSELLKEQSLPDTTENNNSSTSENTTREEHVTKLANGLIVGRKVNGKWFGTIGKYKITEEFEDELTFIASLSEHSPDWIQLSAIVAAINDSHQQQLEAQAKLIQNMKERLDYQGDLISNIHLANEQ